MSVSGVGGAAPQVAAQLRDLMATVLAARPAVAQAQQTAAAHLDVHLASFDAYL